MNFRICRLIPCARFHKCPRACDFESGMSFRGVIPWITIFASGWSSKIRFATLRTLAITNRSVHFLAKRSFPPTMMNHIFGRSFACEIPFSQCQRRLGPYRTFDTAIEKKKNEIGSDHLTSKNIFSIKTKPSSNLQRLLFLVFRNLPYPPNSPRLLH